MIIKDGQVIYTFSVNTEDEIIAAFTVLKVGLLNRYYHLDSEIKYNGISIKAGYFENASQVINYFKAIQEGNIDALIENLPNTEDAIGYYELFNNALRSVSDDKKLDSRFKKYQTLFLNGLDREFEFDPAVAPAKLDKYVRRIVLQLKQQK